jgi:hypothetical protein
MIGHFSHPHGYFRCDRRTDGRTDGRTDNRVWRQALPGARYRLPCPWALAPLRPLGQQQSAGNSDPVLPEQSNVNTQWCDAPCNFLAPGTDFFPCSGGIFNFSSRRQQGKCDEGRLLSNQLLLQLPAEVWGHLLSPKSRRVHKPKSRRETVIH